jgi:hypothetical protein
MLRLGQRLSSSVCVDGSHRLKIPPPLLDVPAETLFGFEKSAWSTIRFLLRQQVFFKSR